MPRKEQKNKLLKIVYFDEPSARDYIDIVNGGHLDWNTEEDKAKLAKIIAEIDAEVGGGFKFLTWLTASVNGNFNASYDNEARTLVGTKLKNTVLTDYIKIAKNDKNIENFKGIVYAPESSMSIYKMYSPYTVIVPKDEVPIDLEKLNEALEAARGYYEMLLSSDDLDKIILRFNSKAFRNNYNLSDLTKMNLIYYGIYVGDCEVSKLDMSKEFNYEKEQPEAEDYVSDTDYRKEDSLKVYDIVLAGVEK